MSYYGPEQVEQVKRGIDAVAVIGGLLELRRAGDHQVARCCFHDDRTPSLHVYDDGHFHCFGCGAHGDVVDLVMHKECCTFQEAIARLAKGAGVTLVERAQQHSTDDLSGLYRAMEFATDLYERTLDTVTGARALAYLLDRKLTRETIRKFRIGWAHGEDALVVAALDAGISSADLVNADLAKSFDGRLRDRFYQRLVVPITDASGRVVAFSARMLPDDLKAALESGKNLGKYVNSTETPIFRKGLTVYNLHRAKSAVRQRERLVLMEGALDVIAATQAGWPECCAPLGTAFTDDQAQLVTKASAKHDVVIALDGDAAGQASTGKVVRALLTSGASVKVAVVPDGMDPAEALVEDATAESRQAFADAITGAKPGLPWVLNDLAEDIPEGDQPGRLRALDAVIALIKALEDLDLRDLYLLDAAKFLKVDRATARRRLADRVVADCNADTPPPPPAADLPRVVEPERFELNEHGNAMRFLARFGSDVLYCETWGRFLVWNGCNWQIDDKNLAVDRMMVATIEGIGEEIGKTLDHDYREALLKWKIRNKNDRPLGNSISRLKSLVAVKSTVFDTDPWLFTCANGTIDLRSGELREHRRDDRITRASALTFDPAARDPKWDAFLSSLANHDSDLAAFIQRAAGYSATGVAKSQAAFMACGKAGTGKSTLIQAMVSVLGGYARSIPFEIFLSSHSDKRKWSLAEISQCRLVVCEESEEGKRFNASLIKQISGGTPIEAERKGSDPFTYLPLFKVWFVCNDAPYVSDTDAGFWRRMHLVRCDNVPAKRDNDLQPYLTTDPAALRAILAWMVAGAAAYAQQGLNPPASVLNANQAYKDDQDPLRDVLAELFTLDPNGVISKADFWQEYRHWCDRSGVKHPLSQKGLGMRLAARHIELDAWNYDADLRRSVSAYRGIRLRLESDGEAQESSPTIHPSTSLATPMDPIDVMDDIDFTAPSASNNGTVTKICANDEPVANDPKAIVGYIVGYNNQQAQQDLDQIANDVCVDPVRTHTRDDTSYPVPPVGGMNQEAIVGYAPAIDPADQDFDRLEREAIQAEGASPTLPPIVLDLRVCPIGLWPAAERDRYDSTLRDLLAPHGIQREGTRFIPPADLPPERFIDLTVAAHQAVTAWIYGDTPKPTAIPGFKP